MERRINKHNEGTDVTEERLKSLILEMIKEEDKKNPFSDQTLSRLLWRKWSGHFQKNNQQVQKYSQHSFLKGKKNLADYFFIFSNQPLNSVLGSSSVPLTAQEPELN